MTATLTGGLAPARRCAASTGPRSRSAPTIDTIPDTWRVTDPPPGSLKVIESPGTAPRFDARSRLIAISPWAMVPDDGLNNPVVAA